MSMMEGMGAKWTSAKPMLVALVVGLVAGPIITNAAGWQVTTGTADAAVLSGVVDRQAKICAAQARAEVPETAKLDWSARSDLAKKWAIMPGATVADADVASACSRMLSS